MYSKYMGYIFTCLAVLSYGTLCFFKVDRALKSGLLPTCQDPRAALSTLHLSCKFLSLINLANTASAIGERQILPKTKIR